jgi:hypothetical protein
VTTESAQVGGGSASAPDECSKAGPAVTNVSLAVVVGLVCALLSALGTNLASC